MLISNGTICLDGDLKTVKPYVVGDTYVQCNIDDTNVFVPLNMIVALYELSKWSYETDNNTELSWDDFVKDLINNKTK